MNSNTLIVDHVVKQYAGHTALDDVSLSVPKQSIYGLLGPNGAGKTTLLRIINQIIRADQGNIYIDGEPLVPKHISVIGYLPEERGLYKKMKVSDQLIYLGQLRNLSKADSIRRSKAWCEKLDMMPWWNRKVQDLSKGMAQKIQFISTVLHRPKLIILDEPFSGFDPINANLIRDEIVELRDKGSTVIFSTHRMESVEELCDDIALINRSKVILEGKKKTVKNTYKDGTYIITYKGRASGFLAKNIDLLTTERLQDDVYESTVQIGNGMTPNALLKAFMDFAEISRFVEKIPSVNDIFIAKVKETAEDPPRSHYRDSHYGWQAQR